ncbi:hypothetical protein B9Z55_027248 [Caenorhabditis nigoni]|uniref:Uncharacterized protein n=1 Tax=Caenorhabditis nigoni TaxID=1611254 RepID=A0A2G5SGU0_9PELO|nr:hypothetical protein B9Z55_027248 [Caenorhabditis nigoni]
MAQINQGIQAILNQLNVMTDEILQIMILPWNEAVAAGMNFIALLPERLGDIRLQLQQLLQPQHEDLASEQEN